VNDLLGAGQVRRNAKEATRQVLDRGRPEVVGEKPVHAAARRQRDQRERGADEPAAAGEGSNGSFDPLVMGETLSAQRGHDRLDAGPAHHVDGHTGFLQRSQRAEVSESSRPAAGEHRPQALPVTIRARRAISSGWPSQRWWKSATGRDSSQRDVPDGLDRWTSTSSQRSEGVASARASTAPSRGSPPPSPASSTTSAWLRHSRLHAVSPGPVR
jgi:hypothetical protein